MPEQNNDLAAVEELNAAYKSLTTEIGKVIIGQQEIINQLLISLLARGHCLLVGVPGLAKTCCRPHKLGVGSIDETISAAFTPVPVTFESEKIGLVC